MDVPEAGWCGGRPRQRQDGSAVPSVMAEVRHLLRGCGACGLVQRVGAVPRGHEARCPRCGSVVRHAARPKSRERAAALSLGALVLYPAAMTLPVIEVSRLGHTSSATIWSGVVDLAAEGQPIVAAIVLICSIVVPLAKIGGMFLLCAGGFGLGRRGRAHTYRAIDFIGRWGMVDVLLVAVLVAAVKLGNWLDVHPGPGALAFSGVVLLSLLSSAVFDPHAIWEEDAG